MLLCILQQFFSLSCSYYLGKEVRFFRQQYVFILCSFAIQQNVAKFLKKLFPSFLCFCYSVAWSQGFSSNNMLLFYVFFPVNRMASKHVFPFCVYVIQENGTKITQVAMFSYFDFYHSV